VLHAQVHVVLQRSLLEWTIWLTANGAAPLRMRLPVSGQFSRDPRQHSSSSSGGRAFSAGKLPTTRLALASTSSGLEMMNSGAPMTQRRCCSSGAGHRGLKTERSE